MIYRLIQDIAQDKSTWDYCVEILATLPSNH